VSSNDFYHALHIAARSQGVVATMASFTDTHSTHIFSIGTTWDCASFRHETESKTSVEEKVSKIAKKLRG